MEITRPDDWHHHFRDGDCLKTTVPFAARQFRRCIAMPNLKPPVTTIAAARAYKKRILAHVPEHLDFCPLMTLYLTDSTALEDLTDEIIGCKLYPAGATTNSESGVTSVFKILPILKRMADLGLVLLIHGETTKGDIFEREKQFLEEVMPTILTISGLKIVLEHITTKDAVDFVKKHDVAATITAHHLLYNRNALFQGGICPHFYCLPILKHETHRHALVEAALSGNPKFFLGTDSAPHEVSTKESSCGCAGVFTAHAALELYAEAFEPDLSKLEAFCSFHGPDYYGLPRNTDKITLRRQKWTVPSSYAYAGGALVPLRANQEVHWTLT